DPQRLVQRTQHLLPRLRNPGSGAGHRARRADPGRRGAADVRDPRRSRGRRRGDLRGPPAPRGRRRRSRGRPLRLRPRAHAAPLDRRSRLMASIVVAGALAGKPGNGGEAWVRMTWVRGFRRLGHDVSFVEYAPGASGRAREWFDEVTTGFGIEAESELILDEPSPALVERAAAADLLVDISGNLSTT